VKVELEEQRRLAIEYLAECYARDLISLQGYEDRRDQVEAATTTGEITAATADIVSRQSVPSKPDAPSVVCVMGDRKLTPDRIDGGTITTTCVMGDVVVDLRDTMLTGPVRIHTVTVMGDTVIHVPEAVHVHNDITAIMADVKEKGRPGKRKSIRERYGPPRETPSDGSNGGEAGAGPTIHLTGLALMADVKIRRG
jgi:hypothetical protein